MRGIILYHAGCWDGLLAAYLINGWHFKDTATCIPVSYGQPVPVEAWSADCDVFIVDFSYSRDVLDELKAQSNSLTVLDHHKTAKDELYGCSYATFDMTKCGARLAADYILLAEKIDVEHHQMKELIDYVEDRDLWKWELAGSKAVNAFIRSFPLTFESIKNMMGTLVEPGRLIGEAILRSVNQSVEVMIDRGLIMGFDGVKTIPVVNATVHNSEVGHRLLELYPNANFSVTWFRRADRKTQYELRARGDFDCSAVAKAHGGGGHPRAAGYVE
ncbi:hypothetical protein LCGC14_0412600 [marine sediment metagenome]|uniref:DHHA1 domain-containing protein n=1 Tax=marine sediment metagenome TaxID=412755 RepID=A0A0F9SZC7_9ZZZZ